MKNSIVSALFGGYLGGCLAAVGIYPTDWRYWVISVPLALLFFAHDSVDYQD